MLPIITKVHSTWYSAKSRVRAFLKNSDGATAIEYGLIAAGIAVAIIAAVFALGNTISDFFNTIGDNMANAGK
jgi:pilus assembly protein Flp/PilA